MDGNMNTLCG